MSARQLEAVEEDVSEIFDLHLFVLLFNEHRRVDLFNPGELHHFMTIASYECIMEIFFPGEYLSPEVADPFNYDPENIGNTKEAENQKDHLDFYNYFYNDWAAQKMALNIILETTLVNSEFRADREYIDFFQRVMKTPHAEYIRPLITRMSNWNNESLVVAAQGNNFLARHVAVRYLREKRRLDLLKSKLYLKAE